MNTVHTAGVITACLFVAVILARLLRRLLPESHLNSDTKETIKLAMGLIATMSALVLGLLISSAKGSYDAERNQVIQMAAKISFLDRALALYGPESKDARAHLRAAVEESVERLWPQQTGIRPQLAPDTRVGDQVFISIHELPVRDDTQRTIKALALTLATDLGQLRALLMAQSVGSIAKPLLVVVSCWLIVIFFSFSLVAPPNATATLALLISAFAVAGAIFLILELDRPFEGGIQISGEPLQNALSQLGK